MEKLSEINDDYQTASNAAINFFKHAGQLLVQMGSLGNIRFEEERKTIPEERLSDLEGRYLKLTFKNPNPIRNPGPPKYLTPIDEKLSA